MNKIAALKATVMFIMVLVVIPVTISRMIDVGFLIALGISILSALGVGAAFIAWIVIYKLFE